MLLTVKDKDYLIPERWTQVNLGKYQDFMEKSEDIKDATMLDKLAISSFTGLSMDLLVQIRKTDIDVVKSHLNKLSEKKMNTTLNTIIEVEGVDYGFHPNLKDLTFGEFNKYSIEDYDGDSAFERAVLFRDNLSVASVNGAANFFLTIGVEYQAVMKLSLSKEQKQMMKKKGDLQTTTTSIQSGVGTE